MADVGCVGGACQGALRDRQSRGSLMRRRTMWSATTAVLALALSGLVMAPAASGAEMPASAVRVAAAKKKTAKSGSAYARVVAKAAQKAAAKKTRKTLRLTTTSTRSVRVPMKKGRWFASVTTKGYQVADPGHYGYDGAPMSAASAEASKQLRSQLTKRGFTRVFRPSVKEQVDGTVNAWIYRNKTYLCEVSGPQIGCIKRSTAKATVKRATSLYKALSSPSKGLTIDIAKFTPGATKGYRVAQAYMANIQLFHPDYTGLFYKAPDKSWKLAAEYQEGPLCESLERTKDSRRAFAGRNCLLKSGGFRAVRR